MSTAKITLPDDPHELVKMKYHTNTTTDKELAEHAMELLKYLVELSDNGCRIEAYCETTGKTIAISLS